MMFCSVVTVFTACCSGADELDLAGKWRVRIDEADEGLVRKWFANPLQGGLTAALPGSLAQSGLGHEYNPESGRFDGLPNPPYLKWPSRGFTEKNRRDELGHLVPSHMTYGPAWYERDIVIPADWGDRDIRLSLERVKWSSMVWIDGQPIAAKVDDSLHTPHIYDLGRLAPGSHRITIRIDNSPHLNIGIAGHGYGMETEPLWNGVAGAVRLQTLDPVEVSTFSTMPSADWQSVEARFSFDPLPATDLDFIARLVDPDSGRLLGEGSARIEDGEADLSLNIPLEGEVQPWDEFDPKLYRLEWTISDSGGVIESGADLTGLRLVQKKGKRIFLNGKPIFLRGNIDCAIHPGSHTPPADREWWERMLGIHKKAGFNHIRFHTWCPPGIAFDVADELGLYLQVETTYWVDDWIHSIDPHPPAIGQNEQVDEWIMLESSRIIETYKHHPSFVMFSIGNELGVSSSDWNKINEIIGELKSLDRNILLSSQNRRRT